MAYAPPPPSPFKRPYPGDWNSPPRPPKEPRPPGTDEFYQGAGSSWGSGYTGDYGYYGWGNPDYRTYEPESYQETQSSSSNNINVDFTDDYAAFYGKDPTKNRGHGNQRGRGQRGRGDQRGRGNQRGRGAGPNQSDSSNTQAKLHNVGQFNQNRGQGNQNRGRGNDDVRGRGNQNNRGRGNQDNRGTSRGAQRGQFRGRGRGVQRGMPPNVFSSPKGRGKGSNRGALVVPPVHSLAKAKPETLDIKNMSMAEKLHRFCLFLRSDDSIKINAIQTIMNAITSSKLGLKVDYQSEELARVAGKPMYTGVLKLDTVFLARAIRPNKKDLKQEVFQKALIVMLSMTVAEIYNLVDPGADAIREELERQMKSEEMKMEDVEDKGSAEAKSLVGGDVQTILSQLINAIKNMKSIPDSPISVLEQAATQAHILIKHEYNVEINRLRNGHLYCRGMLSIGPVVIGRGGGLTKKKCKTATYEKALERLKTLDIAELMQSVPEEPIPDNVELACKFKNNNLSLEERFAELIRSLGSMALKESCVNQIDIAAMANGITPIIIFKLHTKKGEQHNNVICELYLDKVFISSTEGPQRRDCMARAYTAAWEVLNTTSVETLMTQHRRITEEELKDPALLDVIRKGTGRTVDSNMAGLRRFGYQVEEIEKRKIEDLVLIEHSDWCKDRIRNSFCILQYSCNQNGMVLQWETDAIKNYFRCVISVQKNLLGESYGNNKSHARTMAATDALFHLYETQDVIKVSPRLNDEKNWIPWDSIQQEANKLRNENVGEEPVVKNDEYGNPLPDAFLMKVLKSKVDEFIAGKEKKGELIFGPGISLTEGREVRVYTRDLNLKCDTMYHQGEPYLLIYWKMELKDLVKQLKGIDRPYGKYSLVDKTAIPKHAEVLANIMKDIPKLDDLEPSTSKKSVESAFGSVN